MMTSWNVQKIATGDQGHPPTLNATILYEDLSTGQRANVLFDRIVRQLDSHSTPEVELLRMDMLGNSIIKSAADRAAAESGLVIVSLHGQQGLSRQVENWIKSWIGRKKDAPLAIVLLLDRESEQPEKNRVAARLKKLAALNNVECFSYFYEPEEREESDDMPHSSIRHDTFPLFPTAAPENHQMRFWGINE